MQKDDRQADAALEVMQPGSSDLEELADWWVAALLTTNHLGTDAAPIAHPVVALIARELLNKSENEGSGVVSYAFIGQPPQGQWHLKLLLRPELVRHRDHLLNLLRKRRHAHSHAARAASLPARL